MRRIGNQWLPVAGMLAILLWVAGCSPAKESPAPPPPPSPPPATLVTNLPLSLPQRRAALRALARNETGAQQLLAWVRAGILPLDLRPLATLELAHVPWTNVAAQAAEFLPPFLDRETRLLPPLAQLASRQGDPASGAQVFRRPEVNCIGCHLVNGEGVVLGSDLSDIGLRMDRESLVENLLDPSVIITKGYETWHIVLQNDDEYLGVLAGETDEAVSMRDAKNNRFNLKKADFKTRRQVPVSIMPAGLQQTVTTGELVDLIEYLASLKRPPATNAPAGPR